MVYYTGENLEWKRARSRQGRQEAGDRRAERVRLPELWHQGPTRQGHPLLGYRMPQVRSEDASGQLGRLHSARVGVEMRKVEDEELERIKRRKLEEMMGSVSNRPEEENQPMKTLGKLRDLNDVIFTSFVKENAMAVVDVWAPWCGPCRFVSPIVEELARDYAGKIAFGKLNVDQNQRVATQYGIMSIPTILVFKNGKLVDQIVGAMPRQRLEPRITRHL